MYKPRLKSSELLALESLHARMELPEKSTQYYWSLKKGYEGELRFDSFTEKLECDRLQLNDLLLKSGSTTYQIDSVLVTAEAILLYEVKNYDGDYYYDSKTDTFYKKPNHEITNPLHQLSRSESLFRKQLEQLGYHLPIKAYLIFVNDSFTLYQAPLNKPIIYPTQIKKHFQQLNAVQKKLNRKLKHLAEKIVSLHISKSPFSQLPPYEYSQLKKGMICKTCHSLSTYTEGWNCICRTCNHEEKVETAVMRSVREFQLLFPERKVTTSTIHDWCRVVESKRWIRNILNRNMKQVGRNRWAYYI